MRAHTTARRPALALLALLLLGVLWGGTIPLTKLAVSSGHQPLGLIFWQMSFSATALALLLAGRRRPLPLRRRYLLHYLIIALLGTVLPNSASYLAAAELPAGVMAIVIASVPMFALLTALALRLERFAAGRAVGVLCGAAAVTLLVGPDASLPRPEQWPFVLVALIAPACYGLEGNYLTLRAPPGLDPAVTLFGASLCGALIAAPLALGFDVWVDLSQRWSTAEWALLWSSLLHVFAYTGYIWLVGVAGPVFASQVAYVVTAAGVLLSALLLGELYSGWVWAALALMLIGLALVQPRRDR